jgi:hypothetical protein
MRTAYTGVLNGAMAASHTFTGGTGRFASAAGRATIRGQAILTEARSEMKMEGS